MSLCIACVAFFSLGHPDASVVLSLSALRFGAMYRSQWVEHETFVGRTGKRVDRITNNRAIRYRLQMVSLGDAKRIRIQPVSWTHSRNRKRPIELGDIVTEFTVRPNFAITSSRSKHFQTGNQAATPFNPANPVGLTYPENPVRVGDRWTFVPDRNSAVGIKLRTLPLPTFTATVTEIVRGIATILIESHKKQRSSRMSAVREDFTFDETWTISGSCKIDIPSGLLSEFNIRVEERWNELDGREITKRTSQTISQAVSATEAEIWSPIPPDFAGRGWRTPDLPSR